MNKRSIAKHFGLSPPTIDNLLGNPRHKLRNSKEFGNENVNAQNTTDLSINSSRIQSNSSNGAKNPHLYWIHKPAVVEPKEEVSLEELKASAI